VLRPVAVHGPRPEVDTVGLAEALYKLHHMGAHDGYVVTKAVAEACYSGCLLLLQALSEALSNPA